jgi:hypothetical protein
LASAAAGWVEMRSIGTYWLTLAAASGRAIEKRIVLTGMGGAVNYSPRLSGTSIPYKASH